MSEKQDDYLSEARALMGWGDPPAFIDPPRRRIGLSDGLKEYEVSATVTINKAFRQHIRHLKGAKLSVWLFITLSIEENWATDVTLEEISDFTGYSRETVITAIQDMESDYLIIERQPNRNIYTPTMRDRVKKLESNLPNVNTNNNDIKDINTFGKLESKNLTLREELSKSPDWAMAMGVDYNPDPMLAALDDIRRRWESSIKYARWEKWGSFDKWLLAREQEGQKIEQYAQYLRETGAMKFIQVYTPEGDRHGKNSHKAMWPLAFGGNHATNYATAGQELGASGADPELVAFIRQQRAEREKRRRLSELRR